MIRVSALSLLLAACTSAPQLDPFDPADVRTATRSEDRLEALVAIDRIEDTGNPAAGPHLLAIQTDRDQPLERRARAAAALAELGYSIGESFCLAILTGGLTGSEKTDRAHALPPSDRWAFARELALRPLCTRLREHAIEPPAYDPNFGAPDLRRAAGELRRAIASLPALAPAVPRDALAAAIPEQAPEDVASDQWRDLRNRCLQEARP